jgi:hypothetical protein
MRFALMVHNSTLLAIGEHTTKEVLGGSIQLTEEYSLISLDHEVVRKLILLVEPSDKTIDAVIKRLVL